MKKWDYILIVSLTIISVVWIIIILRGQSSGEKVIVKLNDKVIYTALLNEDSEYLIKTGNDYNNLVIKDGEAYIDDANCKGLDCVRMGHISRDGESIICIPHSVIVTVESDKDNNIDFVSE